MLQSKKFDDQQKDDYLYLKGKFDNAKVGDWIEWARTTGDIGQELITDPTLLASAFFIPWTGGTSLAARITAGKAAQTALSKITNKQIADGVAKGFAKLPGQKLKAPLTPVQTHALVGTEAMAWGSTYDYLTQNREINIGQREEYDIGQTALTGAIGGALGYGASFGLRHLAQTPSYLRSVEEKRLAKIDLNDEYKSTTIEKANQLALETLNLLVKPTSSFLIKAKKSPTLSKLIKLFRYDAEKSLIAEGAGQTSRMKEAYSEKLGDFIGNNLEKLKEIFIKYDLYELGSKDEVMPFSQGAFINPFRSKERRTRKSILKSYRLNEQTNIDLANYIRTGNKKGLDDNLVKAGDEIKALLGEILESGRKSGLNIGEMQNFFPRVWLQGALTEEGGTKFINKLAKDEFNGDVIQARETWKNMTNLNKVDGTSAAPMSSIKASRKLLKIDDSKYSEFLDNNVENVLQDYIFQAGKLITRKEVFGETAEEFSNRYVKKIVEELGGNFSEKEINKLTNIYLFTTGQRGYINSPTGRFLSDFIQVSTQTALLPFATVTSFAEIGVPLLRGAEFQPWAKSVWKGMTDSASEWWKGVQVATGKDIGPETRSLTRKELNAFNRSVDMAREDRAMAIYGQALGRNSTKIQNTFFKGIFLHDWTRFVQLVGYDTGKGMIVRNLEDLSKGGLDRTTRQRLAGELNELGIDIEAGLRWIRNGAEYTDDFYLNEVRKGAGRYTDEVVMNPTTASNQKPLVHSHPLTKWAFGLLGFPTSFSNTVLKNAVREITKDVKNGKTSRLATPKVLSGILVMMGAGMVGNTIRTGGRNLQLFDDGKKPLWSSDPSATGLENTGLLNDALIRSGLFGPFEYYVRYEQARKYQNNITAALTTITGPAVGDIVDYVRASQYRGATYEAIFRKAPFITVLRSQFPEKYKEALAAVRELDKSGAPVRPEEDEIMRFATGGLVSGPDVPFTKEDPADRINPLTGESYRENFVVGGIAGKLAQRVQRFGKTYKADEVLEQMERLATTRDPGGSTKFVSPSLKTMIERGPQNIKGPQILDWLKASTNKGIRPDEVKELGIESYVIKNPEATLGEVVEAVSPRQTRLTKAIKDKEKVDKIKMETSIAEYDPIDNTPLWSSLRDDYEYDINQGADYISGAVLAFGKEQYPDIVGNVSKIKDLPTNKQDELLDNFAKYIYKDDPYEIIRPKTDNLGNTFALGNENTGYTFFVNGVRNDDLASVHSHSEAKITLNRLIREEFGDLDVEGEAYRYKQYIDENLPGGENYREVVFELADAKVPSNVSSHFDEENYLAHALVRDRKLTDNTKTLHIDELQSDLHSKAKASDYDTPENRKNINERLPKLKSQVVTKRKEIEKYMENDEGYFKARPSWVVDEVKDFLKQFKGIELINEVKRVVRIDFKENKEFFNLLDEYVKVDNEYVDLVVKQKSLLPDYPYKENWHTVVINRLLAEAIDEGYDAISLSPAKVLSDRYTDSYEEFYSNLYDKKVPSYLKKLARRYKGKFEKGELDVEDTFGTGEDFLMPADVFEGKRKITDVNILRITPEMREMLEKEGLQAFNEGGLVGDVIRYNNPGNIERGQGYAGETGQFYAEDRERPFVVFDTPEAGMRAIVRDMNTKLNRYASFKDEAIDYALLEYLGGGRTGTKEERLKRAEIENPDTIGYLKEGSDLYKQKGMEGLLRTIINRENNPENAAFYNDDNLIKRALKISEKDFPTGTTSEEMFKLLNN
jgi:hypothetical protein